VGFREGEKYANDAFNIQVSTGFVVDKVALGQVSSEYFGFPCQSSFQQFLNNHPHLSCGAGTIGQKWSQYKGLSPTPLAIKK
jgi:hypothetical protein